MLRQRILPHPGARVVSLAERRPLMRHHEFMAVKGVGIEFFLESRIGEDEARARAAFARDGAADSRVALTPNDRVSMTGWRMLAECVLKRDMLFVHHDVPQEGSGRARVDIICATCEETYPCQQLRIALAVYSDHPQYEPEWRPHDPDTRAD